MLSDPCCWAKRGGVVVGLERRGALAGVDSVEWVLYVGATGRLERDGGCVYLCDSIDRGARLAPCAGDVPS
jgi:hypothetical protein